MTLLLAAGNAQFVSLAADRRITRDGRLENDEQNKILVLCCDDARVTIGYCGLAEFDGEQVSGWLIRTLAEREESRTCTLDNILDHLRRKLEELFANSARCRGQQFCLLVTGFAYWPTPVLVCRELTNVTLGGKPLQFSSYTYQPNEDGVLSHSSGVPPSALAWETARLARSCADPQVQPGHIVRRLVRTIQTFSGSKTAGGLVGAQCNTATVPSDADTPIHTTYHSAHESLAAYSADVVMTFSNGDGMALAGIEILSSGKFFLAGPKIAKRNHCWCGSGREFRHCHLRIMGSVYAKLPGPSFPRPTPFFVRLRRAPGSGPSGEVFLVRSSLE